MRHNQNARHVRGRRSNSNGHGGSPHHHQGNNGQQRRVNPRVQTFDSNGPDVRIRGNAFQITEKYQTLARDASSAGDRVLAESYFQHAEHYQRMINEMNEEYARQNPSYNPNQGYENAGAGPQPTIDGAGAHAQPQPSAEGMNDLDQGFLVGTRSPVCPSPESLSGDAQPQPSGVRQGGSVRQKETEAF